MATKRHISSRIGDVVYDEIVTAARADRTGKSAAIQNLFRDGLRWRMLESGVSAKFLSELSDGEIEIEYRKFTRAITGDSGVRFEAAADGKIPLFADEILVDGQVFVSRGGCR